MTSDVGTKLALRRAGFEGFLRVSDMYATGLGGVPRDEGVYAVVGNGSHPRFLDASPAGRFKGRDPTVPVALLAARWVGGAELLYVGKAPRGANGNRGLRVRLGELLAFGFGLPVGHWGGRYVWQLSDRANLEVAWGRATSPAQFENEMLISFNEVFGSYPFANIAGPRR